MAISTSSEIIEKWRERYKFSNEMSYSKFLLPKCSSWSIENNGFMGSLTQLFLQSQDSIHHWHGACVASKEVCMSATNIISLGFTGEPSLEPLRLFISDTFLCKARHIAVTDFQFIEPLPYSASVECKKITFCRNTEEEPESFEILESCLTSDPTEVEKIVFC